MEKFNKLSRTEMKMVTGGTVCLDCFINYGSSQVTGPSCGETAQEAYDNLNTNMFAHPTMSDGATSWGCAGV